MFVEAYLRELKQRRYRPAAFVTYVRKSVALSRANLTENPDAARSIVVNAVGFFAFFFAVAMALSFATSGGVAKRLIVFEGVWIGLGTTWLLLHVGLLRDRSGVPRRRLGLANQLTFLRILLVPCLHLFLVEGFLALALAVYAIAGLSDILDGYAARRLGQQTRLGLVLDPLVDVGYIFAIFGGLYQIGWIPGWVMAIVTARYVLLLGGTVVLYLVHARVRIHPTAFGRITGIVISVFVVVLFALGLTGRFQLGGDLHAVVNAGLGFLFAAGLVQILIIGIHNLRGGDARHASPGTAMGVPGDGTRE